MLTGRMFFYRGASLGASLFLALMFLTCGGVGAAQDGKAYFWEQVTGAAPWAARRSSVAVVFQNKLWLLGGGNSSYTAGALNDVWSSADGVTWTEETPNAPWPARMHHAGCVFKDKMWIVGGEEEYTVYGDLWSSSDGVHWDSSAAGAPCSARDQLSLGAMGDQLYLYGGDNNYTLYNDVWSSGDGLAWTKLTANAGWAPRGLYQSVVFQNKIWILGGWTYESGLGTFTYFHDSWYSSDGASWTASARNAPWLGRQAHAAVAFDDQLWVLGGGYIEGTPPYASIRDLNDVWHSENGREWTQAPNAPWAVRAGHAAVVFGGKLWVLGGKTIANEDFLLANDVWSLTAAAASIQMDHTGPYQAGEALTMTVAAPGLPSGITYQWFKDGVVLSGQTSATYRVSAVAEGDAGSYSCGIGGAAFGTAGPAALSITPAPKVSVGSCVLLGSGFVVLLTGRKALHS